jgi:hypothetical protein
MSNTPPSLLWLKQYPSVSTVGNDSVPNIVSDSSGNTYITYWTSGGTVSGGTNAGGAGDIVVFKLDSNGSILWIKQERIMNSSGVDQVPVIALDDLADNIYVSYQTSGTVSGGTAIAGNNIVVFKMNSSGTLLWIQQQPSMSTPGGDEPRGIVTDSSGNVYVSYLSTSGAASGGTNFNNTFDIIVFKLNTSGVLQWIRQQTAFNSNGNDLYPSISIDLSANVYIAYQAPGVTSGGTLFGPQDIIVFKMDSSGTLVWTRQQTIYNTSGDDSVASISVDLSGNAYVTYQTTGTSSGGTKSTNDDIVVFKMNTNGTLQWIRQQPIINSTGTDSTPRIISDSSGNIYITYFTTGTTSGGTLTTSSDIVVFEMDTNGTLQWIIQQPIFNTNGSDTRPSIAIDSNYDLYISYQSTGTASGGTFIGTTGNSNIIVFKLQTFIPPSAPILINQPHVFSQSTEVWWNYAPSKTPITSYEIYSNNVFALSTPANAFRALITSLTNGSEYTFTIAGSNAGGLGPFSTYNTIIPGDKPSSPLSPIVSYLYDKLYNISWTSPVSDGGSIIRGFVLNGYPLDSSGNIINDKTQYVKVGVRNTNATSRTISLPSNYNSYKVLVRTVNDPGYSPSTAFTDIIYTNGGSLQFNGSTAYLSVVNDSDLRFGTGDFTVEWFQYQTSGGGSSETVFSIGNSPSATLAVSIDGGSTFNLWINGTAVLSSSVSVYNAWNHFAVTRSGTDVRVFLNGSQLGSTITSSYDFNDSVNDLFIGAQGDLDSSFFYKGFITNFHWVKGTALYTSDFLQVNAPFLVNIDSKLLLRATTSDTAVTDSSSSSKTVSNTNVTWSAQSPF